MPQDSLCHEPHRDWGSTEAAPISGVFITLRMGERASCDDGEHEYGIWTSEGRVEAIGKEQSGGCGMRIGGHGHDVSIVTAGFGALDR